MSEMSVVHMAAPVAGRLRAGDLRLLTGRMHQARRHAAAGDHRYGDPAFNRHARTAGLNPLFLHPERLRFAHPVSGVNVKSMRR